ncbi:hypothetical protein BJP36_40840 [Moorena producens JHB]|uniref:Uncharacterized protein n=1 Tax=Moorena producens (strain JHB) TaxID=1454205 RepID=A0A9Q9SSB5_MOOP1|nr:hypothetical protein [Moorena producens]WAN68713.1 hypothetical protein BJP36_40840 [Moorena producens JHB]
MANRPRYANNPLTLANRPRASQQSGTKSIAFNLQPSNLQPTNLQPSTP